ncbi:MAG: ABC transporter ATP-binding protein [Coriobacteriia bacterium]
MTEPGTRAFEPAEGTCRKSDTSAITIRGARKSYGSGRDAVVDVSLDIACGSVHGLLGPNGAGKTTTLKMLLGLVKPTGGTFMILDRPAGPAIRSRVGFLPEQPYFPALLTADQVLAFYGRLSGLDTSAGKARAAELLPRVGLDGKGSTLVSRFSRGMLQRLGIAQALVASPEVLILDEPASGLDPVGQRDVRSLILELREQGTTVLLSSHQLSEVEAVCDDVTILNRGLVAARGDIDALLNVAGQTSVTARSGAERLPDAIEPLITDVVFGSGTWVFSVPSHAVRAVVDALDDEGWAIIAVAPKRESLEDYFAGLLSRTPEGAGDMSRSSAGEVAS